MAQDQIAKLMAIAGRTTEADSTSTGTSSDTSNATEPTSPPPLQKSTSITSLASVQPANDQPARRVARRRPAGPVRGKIAANDDVPSIGGLIYALEQKPSTKIFRLATLASITWTIVGIGYGAFTLAPEYASGASIGTLLLHPVAFYTATAVIVPVGIFWLLALLNWHIASLALKSSTMTEVAIRLAEPDRAAEQSIASLGQAVRRQVSFMNDAVSRALGRAGELEALVHNQVADLERSYEQNERRIRGLIQELTGERHALLNTSGSVTDTLRTLGTEIPQLIEKLSTQQVTLAQIIKGAGENLTTLEGSLATQTGRFENALGSRTQQLQNVLEDYTTAFSTALGARTEQMRVDFDTYMHTLDASLGNRTENLQTVFEEYARALDTTLANRAQALDIQLIERTQSLDSAFQKRLELFDEQIVRSTSAIDSAVSEKAALLTDALELHSRTFRDTISQQAAELDDSVMNGVNAVRRTSENITRQTMKAIDGLSQQSGVLQHVAENLFQQIHGVTSRFENQGQTILKVAGDLSEANTRIDHTLQTRHADISRTLDRLSGKADEFGRSIASYSTNLEGSLSNIEGRARAFAEELRDGTELRSQSLMADLERVKNQTEAESERTLSDLRQRFNSVSGELSKEFESLSTRLASASDETRLRAAEAAETLAREQARIREESARLPASSRETADAMRRALNDQLKALDQLSKISARASQQRDIVTPELAAPLALSRPMTTLASALAKQDTPPSRGRGALTTDGRDNWSLGDLLARASHDEEALAEERAAAAARAATQAAADARREIEEREAADARDAAALEARVAAAKEVRQAAQQARNAAAAAEANANRTQIEPFRLDVAVISRAVDPATASAIWNRIRAGQRNVMVRSIYSPDARGAFDQVASRIKTDNELAQTVARYLGDFERIIKDADARDTTGRLAHTHLISDTGRVYLFLAHASGRIS